MILDIKPGNEYDYFNEDVINLFFKKITEDIIKYLSTTNVIKKGLVGAMALHEVPLKNGYVTKVWIEYNGKFLDIGIDTGISRLILYDDVIPDLVLDRYNKIKRILEQDD